MPWCDSCDRYFNPNTVNNDGTCPTCGTELAKPTALHRSRRGKGSSADAAAVRAERSAPVSATTTNDLGSDANADDNRVRAPWHFWLLLVALAIYLSWRLIQLVVIVAHKF